MAKGEFHELFSKIQYDENLDRYIVSLKVDASELGERERKKLKDRIILFENNKEWINVFKVEVLNKVEL